ncbi:serine hydrolase domain-containing protein [Kordiimonas pumila]|uniref:Serine hydrolase domain-containing protein n=1 Tax=Kordiimonas pumila TaxID=2161677 RepID=A0ABV7D5P8_9PROT|nr:serine hydrolase domain-containing protein [Kordiimonas pumila]
MLRALAIGIFLVLGVPVLAQNNTVEVTDAHTKDMHQGTGETLHEVLEATDLKDWVDGYMSAALKQGDIAGAVVSIVQNGRIVMTDGYGYADIEAKTPMDPRRTLMRVGSTSKLFTWTAVMQLVEQGKLDLNEDINSYLDFKIPDAAGGPITMKSLMNHRGGFEEGLKEVLLSDPKKFISNEQFLKAHIRPRIYPVGKVPSYSNYGTALAGYIVQRLSGEHFDDYIDRHILEPLAMNSSTFRQPLPQKYKGRAAKGYIDSTQSPWPFELLIPSPAGSLSSTAEDMANFMIAHLQKGQFEGKQILESSTAETMYSNTAPHQPGFPSIAHGFLTYEENGRRVIGHGGDTILFHTEMKLVPEENVGLFVSFNSRGKQDAFNGIRERIFKDFMDRYFPDTSEPKKQVSIASALSDAKALAGKYRSSRRIQTAFLHILYILDQTTLIANDDGTVHFSSQPYKKYAKTAPNLWQEINGDDAFFVSVVDGVKTLSDMKNPTSVLQEVPLIYNSTLNNVIFLGSIAIMLLALIAWPVGWWLRRIYNQLLSLAGKPLLTHRLTLGFMIVNLIYLFGWYLAVKPLLATQLDIYTPEFDGYLRLLQVSAIIPILGSCIATYNALLALKSDRYWAGKLVSIFYALAMIGILWVASLGGFVSFTLEY